MIFLNFYLRKYFLLSFAEFELLRVTRYTETKPKYRNVTEIPKRTIKNIEKKVQFTFMTFMALVSGFVLIFLVIETHMCIKETQTLGLILIE